MTQVKVYRKGFTAQLPEFGTQWSACFDLRAHFDHVGMVSSYDSTNAKIELPVLEQQIIVPPGTRVLVPTGLIFDLDEGTEMKIYLRSSVAYKLGLFLANSTGIVDADYVDETYVMLYNATSHDMVITQGDRIAQAQIVNLSEYRDIVEVTDEPVQKTDRTGGVGSTGTN